MIPCCPYRRIRTINAVGRVFVLLLSTIRSLVWPTCSECVITNKQTTRIAYNSITVIGFRAIPIPSERGFIASKLFGISYILIRLHGIMIVTHGNQILHGDQTSRKMFTGSTTPSALAKKIDTHANAICLRKLTFLRLVNFDESYD